MNISDYSFDVVRAQLKPQLRRCRDRNIRVKAELILYVLKYGNVSECCRKMGFSRGFFYKWFKRLASDSFRIRALVERSRRPRSSPNRITASVEKKILHYRKKGFGAAMTQEMLKREDLGQVSQSTIKHVFNDRMNVVKRRPKRRLKKHRKRYELPIPGQRLQVDVKYSPMPVGGKTVYIYVAIDECTRWRFAYAYEELNAHWTIDFLDRMRRQFPFPINCLQTDNGHEFTYRLLNGREDHEMALWCQAKGIRHRLIPPGLKELNGKVERSHRIDADYFYGSAPTANIKKFNKALERWIKAYNLFRPHGGINYQTPLEKLKERICKLKDEDVPKTQEQIKQKFLDWTKLIDKTNDTNNVA